ncbi:hypothetical protein BH09BAC4_BH09BAC4_05510 [soil metagenome]
MLVIYNINLQGRPMVKLRKSSKTVLKSTNPSALSILSFLLILRQTCLTLLVDDPVGYWYVDSSVYPLQIKSNRHT